MKFPFIATAAISILMAAGTAVLAQHDHNQAAKPAAAAATPSTQAFRAANDRMHKEMAIAYSGDADVDFVRGMIPHHQGAIDMARVVLQHGKDPQIRKLAQDIVDAQEKEIALMREWLKARGR